MMVRGGLYLRPEQLLLLPLMYTWCLIPGL